MDGEALPYVRPKTYAHVSQGIHYHTGCNLFLAKGASQGPNSFAEDIDGSGSSELNRVIMDFTQRKTSLIAELGGAS